MRGDNDPGAAPVANVLGRGALMAIGIGSALSALDLFVVNLAFSSILRSYAGSSVAAVSWVLSIYSTCFAATLVLSGRMADRYGRRWIFCLGLGLFGLSSLFCALASALWVLVLARALQGVAAAMLVPTSLGLLLAAYPQHRHKQVIGLWAATGSVAAAIGPILGGLLVGVDWHLVFAINLPLVLLALYGARRLPESGRAAAPMPDLLGSALLVLGVASLVGTVGHLSSWSSGRGVLLAQAAASALLIYLLARHCRHAKRPVLDLALFRQRSFRMGTLGMGCFYMSFAIMLLGATLFLTRVWHWSPLLAGLAFAPGPASAVLASLQIGRLGRSPQQLAVIGSLLYVGAGLWWFVTLRWPTAHAYGLYFLPGLLLTGIGAGIGQTGFIAGGVAGLPAQAYATGSGIINTARQIGAAIGVAAFVAATGSAMQPLQFKAGWLLMSLFGLISAVSAHGLRGSGGRAASA